MARKRAPGGGRKPKGDFAGLVSTLSLRMPKEMRARFEALAMRGKRSLTQEILRRLHQSLGRDRDKSRDEAAHALCYLLTEVIAATAANTAGPNWRSDPFAFRSIRLAFGQVLDALEPPGEIKAPVPNKDDPFSALWVFPGTLGIQLGGDTPEEMARFVRSMILTHMRQARAEADQEGLSMARPSRTAAQEDFEYAMPHAVRYLKLKEPNQ
jgi:Arc-like DNA binding domain